MDFRWTQEQLAFKESVRKFAEKEISPGTIERDLKGEFHWEAWKKAGEFGLLGLPIPEEYGGGGADILTMMAAMEGYGYGCKDAGFNLSMSAHLVLCEIPIWKFGTEEQKRTYLPKLCRGEWIGAYALTEPEAGSDAFSLRTSAARKGDYYLLNGTKIFITNGPIANAIVVFATLNRALGTQGITAFIIEKGFPGFSVSKELDKMGARSSPTGELVFEDCQVPAKNMLGQAGQGVAIVLESLEWERACLITARIGSMERTLDKCLRYASERVQFGKPIGQFQLIQEKLANMKVRLETARLMVYKAGWLKQQGIPAHLEASIAKLYLSECSVQSALDAVQIHGGYGYMREFEVERELRDVVASTIGAGTSEIQRQIIARELLKKYQRAA